MRKLDQIDTQTRAPSESTSPVSLSIWSSFRISFTPPTQSKLSHTITLLSCEITSINQNPQKTAVFWVPLICLYAGPPPKAGVLGASAPPWRGSKSVQEARTGPSGDGQVGD